MRILVVEDHADSARMLSLCLRQHGHEVEVAAAAGEACRLLGVTGGGGGGGFDALVCDLALPDEDGWSMMSRLRRGGCGLSAVAVSGYAAPDAERRSLDAGFDRHLAKPLDPGALARVLAGLRPGRPTAVRPAPPPHGPVSLRRRPPRRRPAARPPRSG